MGKTELNGWQGFINLSVALQELKNPQEFFELFLTPSEREDFANRYLIVRELLKNKTNQRDMAAELNVSISKITRGSNELKGCSPELIQFIKQYGE